MIAATGAQAQQLVPPLSYSDDTAHDEILTPLDPTLPSLTRVPDAALANLFRVDPAYRRGHAVVRVVGGYILAEPAGTHFLAAWSPGYLPVTLSFSDGRCYAYTADYLGGSLSNERLARASCDRWSGVGTLAPPPADRPLQLIGSAWGLYSMAR